MFHPDWRWYIYIHNPHRLTAYLIIFVMGVSTAHQISLWIRGSVSGSQDLNPPRNHFRVTSGFLMWDEANDKLQRVGWNLNIQYYGIHYIYIIYSVYIYISNHYGIHIIYCIHIYIYIQYIIIHILCTYICNGSIHTHIYIHMYPLYRLVSILWLASQLWKIALW